MQKVKQQNHEKCKKGHQTMNKKQHKSHNNQQRPKDPNQNELRMRAELGHRVRRRDMKERVKCRVSKVVLAKFGCQTNQKVKRRSSAVHLISQPESKIPKAAAAEILEDCIML
jgi:uncharacterized protein (DUF4415 family)